MCCRSLTFHGGVFFASFGGRSRGVRRVPSHLPAFAWTRQAAVSIPFDDAVQSSFQQRGTRYDPPAASRYYKRSRGYHRHQDTQAKSRLPIRKKLRGEVALRFFPELESNIHQRASVLDREDDSEPTGRFPEGDDDDDNPLGMKTTRVHTWPVPAIEERGAYPTCTHALTQYRCLAGTPYSGRHHAGLLTC